MILVDLDLLSLSDLLGIAEQEGLENFSELTREEIINELREIYDDDEIADKKVNSRYVSGITDFRDIGNFMESLPGVVDLPEDYNENDIHVLLRDSSWLYCFWSVSSFLMSEIAGNGEPLYLILKVRKDGKTEKIHIPISYDDREWSISVPYGPGTCSVALMSGTDRVIAESSEIDLVDVYWLEHRDLMNEHPEEFRMFHSLVASVDGDMVDQPDTRAVLKAFKEEDMKG